MGWCLDGLPSRLVFTNVLVTSAAGSSHCSTSVARLWLQTYKRSGLRVTNNLSDYGHLSLLSPSTAIYHGASFVHVDAAGPSAGEGLGNKQGDDAEDS